MKTFKTWWIISILSTLVLGGVLGASFQAAILNSNVKYIPYVSYHFSTEVPSNWTTQVESDSGSIYYEFISNRYASITVYIKKPEVGACTSDQGTQTFIQTVKTDLQKYGPVGNSNIFQVGQQAFHQVTGQQFVHDEVTTELAMIHNGNTQFHRYDTYTVFASQCGYWEIVSYSDEQHREEVSKTYQHLLDTFVVSPNQVDPIQKVRT